MILEKWIKRRLEDGKLEIIDEHIGALVTDETFEDGGSKYWIPPQPYPDEDANYRGEFDAISDNLEQELITSQGIAERELMYKLEKPDEWTSTTLAIPIRDASQIEDILRRYTEDCETHDPDDLD